MATDDVTGAGPDEPFDVLGDFAQAPEGDDPILTDPSVLAKSVGATFAVMVLTALAFVGGTLWGTYHEPDLGYDNLGWEIAIKVGFAVLCGVAAAAVLLVVVALAVGIPWIRRTRPGPRAAPDEQPPGRTPRRPREH